jgi:hypothetical protein
MRFFENLSIGSLQFTKDGKLTELGISVLSYLTIVVVGVFLIILVRHVQF